MPLTAMYDDILVCVPETAYTLSGFRAWASSAGFPSRGRVTYVQHEVLLDMSPERFESHNQVKSEICRVLGNLVVELDLGKLCHDGLCITNDAADLSNEADGTTRCSFDHRGNPRTRLALARGGSLHTIATRARLPVALG